MDKRHKNVVNDFGNGLWSKCFVCRLIVDSVGNWHVVDPKLGRKASRPHRFPFNRYCSLVLTAFGTLPFAFAAPGTNQIILAAALLLRGAGLGRLLIPIMASAYIGLNRDQVPHASIATRILQTIGGAFGSALLVTIVESVIAILPALLFILYIF